MGVTYGDEGLYRMDLFESGKLAEGWYGSIGGFYRTSEGVRDPQYLSDIGGQLTATLKHTLDNGSVMFWARTMHDHNAWVADFPYTVSNGSVSTYPGFNQLNSTYDSKQLENFQIPNPACNCFENDDISDGRGGDMSYFGSELKESFSDGWSISNNFIFDGGYVNTHALINNGNPTTLGAFIAGDGVLTGTPVTPARRHGHLPERYRREPQSKRGHAAGLAGARRRSPTSTDEFRVNKDFGNGNTLTVGVYVTHYTMNDNWSLSSNVLITNQPNARPIILTGQRGGHIYQVSSPQGIMTPTAATTSCRTATPPISPPIFPTHGRSTVGCSMSRLASSTST